LNLEKLKQLNHAENLLQEYQIKLNLYAIPPETLESLLTLLTGIAREQAAAREQLDRLPTWEHITEKLYPILKGIARGIAEDAESIRGTIRKELSANHEATLLSFQARDKTPLVQRLKWMGAGAAAPTILFLLFTALRLF